MIGQKHYAITREQGSRHQFWRSRGNGYEPGGWVTDMSRARYYTKPDNALRAARQIAKDPGDRVEVIEVSMVVDRVCYRIETHALTEAHPDALESP